MTASTGLLALAAYAAAGAALGLVYFLALWRGAQRLCEGGALVALALTAVRIATLVGGLTAASLHGAAALLATALGVLLGRAALMRALGSAA